MSCSYRTQMNTIVAGEKKISQKGSEFDLGPTKRKRGTFNDSLSEIFHWCR